MGISSASQATSSGNTTFSNDVLIIEICGPQEEHFSVIDVPGIFRKRTPGVTTDKDIGMVRNMVVEYMQNQRSVIMVIVPANVDMATQEIVDMASVWDKSGERTLGVLTKPDLVDPGAEQAVLDVLLGKLHSLKLGWCVVLNPGQKALDENLGNRFDAEKDFFNKREPWNIVSKDQAGTQALRDRLGTILAAMIDREFPDVRTTVRMKCTSS